MGLVGYAGPNAGQRRAQRRRDRVASTRSIEPLGGAQLVRQLPTENATLLMLPLK